MAFRCNGQEVKHDSRILGYRWIDTVVGLKKPAEPSLCLFNNSRFAMDLLLKNFRKGKRIGIHYDVDFDGLGSGYEFRKAAIECGCSVILNAINKDKIHGIQESQVEHINSIGLDLMVIVDSSTNEIETIKKFNCDVLVIDHHEVNTKELIGYCNDGKHIFVTINNTIANYSYESDKEWVRSVLNSDSSEICDYEVQSAMSCGLVVYEVLRLFELLSGKKRFLKSLFLHQWAAMTLFSDSINLNNERNQYYIQKAFESGEMERTLYNIAQSMDFKVFGLNKTYINYSFVSQFNKAIRAGAGSKALAIITKDNDKVLELREYSDYQKSILNSVFYSFYTDYFGNKVPCKSDMSGVTMLDIYSKNIPKEYTGIIATKLSNENDANVCVFTRMADGRAKGSFRGRYSRVDYRKYFADYESDIYAEGHKAAFGFELTNEQMQAIMGNLEFIEPDTEKRPFISLGNLQAYEQGVFHADTVDDLREDMLLMKIAIGNGHVTNEDEIHIRVKACDVKLISAGEKKLLYNVCGLECTAFEELPIREYYKVYTEYSNNINFYIK